MRQVLKDEEDCAEWLGGELGLADREQLCGGQDMGLRTKLK